MIELNKPYSTRELAAELDIDYNYFCNKKDKFLRSLSAAYEYEVEYKGRTTYYTFTTQFSEFQKPERKNNRKKNDKICIDFILKTIEEDNLQTAANINRLAYMEPTPVSSLNLKESTTYEYIRLALREMFGTKVYEGGTHGIISRKIWCYLDAEHNIYVPLEEKAKQYFYECFNNAKEEQMELCSDYDNGLISKKEIVEMLGESCLSSWQSAKESFYNRYTYWPVGAAEYQINFEVKQ